MTAARDLIRYAPALQADMQRLEAMRAIIAALPACDDLRKPQWRGNPNIYAGHCYVASEALWHAIGGPASEWRPQVVRHEGGTHWYLRRGRDDHIVDLTRTQFSTPVPYALGRGCGFLTRQPSRRAVELLKRARLEVASARESKP